MQEDIAGTLRTIGHNTSTCSLCGSGYPTDQLQPVEASPVEGVRSELEDVCPDCRQLLAQGDNPSFPAETEGDPAATG